jgi:hypothetical protein
MKKIIFLVLIIVGCIFITGCESSSGTIICKSEGRGDNPTIETVERYVVENNKVVEFEKYQLLTFDNEYLSKIPLSTVLEVYEKDSEFKVEKVNDTTIKNTYKSPKNYYENIESDNMIETIRSSLEDNAFSLYKYTCEVK